MSKKLFIYGCLGLCLLNLLSVFIYRFRLNKTIDKRYNELVTNISRFEIAAFEAITNYCSIATSNLPSDTSSSQIIGGILGENQVVNDLISSKTSPKREDFNLDYRFFTSGGSPWVELEGEYYTLNDEILGYGVISNCSRVAILLDDGNRIYNKIKPSFSAPKKADTKLELAKNE